MISCSYVLLAGLTVAVLNNGVVANRSFTIDYDNDVFLKDGEPFRYISGSFHYFRALNDTWRDLLRKMRAAGLNAVSTYVEWSQHEPEQGQYNFKGDLDLVAFIKTAQEEDLLVILRPGPYICAERDMGGFPYWLLSKYPYIKLRTNDKNYLYEVEKWLSVLMPKIQPLLYGYGGPVILVQVENEYGSYYACDFAYTTWLRDQFRYYVGEAAILFTTDGNGEGYLKCGKIDGVYATVDFGTGNNDMAADFEAMRKYEPFGPLVNSEFYTGWLTHWGEGAAYVNSSKVAETLDAMLDYGVNVNCYMFHGGSNFHWTAGANYYPYKSDVTSYDYNAPMSEAGDLTEKYYKMQQVISKYVDLPDIQVYNTTKGNYGKLTLKACTSIFNPTVRELLGKTTSATYPKTFESLQQAYGYLLYETQLQQTGTFLLKADSRDHANIYVDQTYQGSLVREFNETQMELTGNEGQTLSMIVENLGRINFGSLINDFKGLVSNVTLNDTVLTNWTMTSYQFSDVSSIENCKCDSECIDLPTSGYVFYIGSVVIEDPADTFLLVPNLVKGVAFVNNFNLGRFWPGRGPQCYLYIPSSLLKPAPEKNVFIVMEEYGKENELILELSNTTISCK